MVELVGPLLFAILAFAPPPVEPKRPPKLTFDHPVDYVAWYNELISHHIAENALDLYKPLIYAGDENATDHVRLPSLSPELQKQSIVISPWSPADRPELAKYINDYRTGLDVIEDAAKRRAFSQPQDHPELALGERIFTLQNSIRTGCRIMLARAWRKPECNAATIIQASKVVLRAAAHMHQCDNVVTSLMAMSLQSMVYQNTLAALHQGLFSGPDCQSAFAAIREFNYGTPDWRTLESVEWATALSAVQYACPKGVASRRNWEHFVDEKNAELIGRVMKADPVKLVAELDEFYAEMFKTVGGPVRMSTVERMRAVLAEKFPAGKESVAKDCFPLDMTRPYELTVRTESQRRATLLVLALHIHYAKHGSWPADLGALDPALSKSLAKYRVDPFSGDLFKYRVKKGEPTLYSVGFDGIDNGGKHDAKWGENGDHPSGDYVFWPFHPGN